MTKEEQIEFEELEDDYRALHYDYVEIKSLLTIKYKIREAYKNSSGDDDFYLKVNEILDNEMISRVCFHLGEPDFTQPLDDDEEWMTMEDDDEIQLEYNSVFSPLDFWLMEQGLPPMDFLNKTSQRREEYDLFLHNELEEWQGLGEQSPRESFFFIRRSTDAPTLKIREA